MNLRLKPNDENHSEQYVICKYSLGDNPVSDVVAYIWARLSALGEFDFQLVVIKDFRKRGVMLVLEEKSIFLK